MFVPTGRDWRDDSSVASRSSVLWLDDGNVDRGNDDDVQVNWRDRSTDGGAAATSTTLSVTVLTGASDED